MQAEAVRKWDWHAVLGMFVMTYCYARCMPGPMHYHLDHYCCIWTAIPLHSHASTSEASDNAMPNVYHLLIGRLKHVKKQKLAYQFCWYWDKE